MCCPKTYLMICAFSRLNLRGAAIDEKNLRGKVKKATLGVGLEIKGGNVRCLILFCEFDNDFVIIGFEADAINLLNTFVFLKVSHQFNHLS